MRSLLVSCLEYVLTDRGHAVLLGADSPLGHLVIHDLRANDYIVIASVSTPESVSEVERLGKGFVKALVLDPTDVREHIDSLCLGQL